MYGYGTGILKTLSVTVGRFVKTYVDDLVIVSDQEIVEAMGLILERCKLVAEPAAASTLAALLSGRLSLPRGSTVVCVLSGGNVDRERLKALL